MSHHNKPNLINRIDKKVYDNFQQMSREDILKSFTPEILNKVWLSICRLIAQNYQSGKGTIIKGFGTFTFTSSEVNLEGTTNQYNRDKKAKCPVFIVSKEFNEYLKPGQYTKKSGLISYNQQLNNNISHVRINYAEISYGLNIAKEECQMIAQNLLLYIDGQIRKNVFKNKDMPGIGTLILKGNILGVKFNEDIINSSKLVPQKLLRTKKDMELYMEYDENKKVHIKDIPDVKQTMKSIRPKTSVNTKIDKSGEEWLKKNLGIDLDEFITQPDEKENLEADVEQENREIRFINDEKREIKRDDMRNKISLKDLNINKNILKAIELKRGLIMNEMREADRFKLNVIQFNDIVNSFLYANVHNNLNKKMVTDICRIYSKENNDVDYMRLMTNLSKDIKNILGIKFTDNSKLNKNVNQMKKPTTALKTNKKLLNMKVGEDENEYRNGLKNFNNRDRQINDIHNEMKVINIVLPNLMSKYETQLNQNISILELMKKLRNFDIVYTKDKITEILNFIEINDINNFTLNEFYKKFSNSKVILNEMSHEDIYNGFRQIKDIIYISGGEKFLFGNKNSITKRNFINLFLNKTKYSYEGLSAIYNFLLKSERDFTISDYKKYFIDDNKIMDSEYDAIQINSFKKKIQSTNLKTDEFFSHLLTYTNSRTNTKISRLDFHKICLNYKFNYTAEEVDHIFDMIDMNKDGFIDRKEWNKIINKIDKPLYQIQDVIKKNKLDIEEIMYTMEIDPMKNQRLNFNQFEEKIKKLDYTYGYDFIKELFHEMNEGNDFIDTNTIIKNFDVFHKENFSELNNNSFKRNFIQNIRMVCDYNELSNYFKKVDRYNDGKILKSDFCSIIQKFCNEFRDEDIMKFTRIMNLIDKNDINLVKYKEFLTKVYYN